MSENFTSSPLFLQLVETQQQANTPVQQNDSWFWEPDTSSTSSKKDDNGSPPIEEAEIDLTTVPLDSNDHELMERLRRQVVDKDSRLKVLGAENKVLAEKLKIAAAENQELNKSIEELDQQHQLAIERVLDVKSKLQEKLTATQDEVKLFQSQKVELQKAHSEAIASFEADRNSLKLQLDQQAACYRDLSEITKSYEQQVEDLSETNFTLEAEIGELKATVNDAPEVIVNNDEYLKKIISLVNANFKMSETYENEDQFMETFTKWVVATATRMRDLDFGISKLIDENKLIKDDVAKHIGERDALKRELEHYEEECSELMKNNNILLADLETLKCSKLETILENDDEENIVVLEKQLEDSNSLNQSLEDEFVSIKSKLEETEVRRSEYFEEIQQLKGQLAENVSRCKSYQEEIENLENEKSNYIFELNELKSEEERNILQKELKTYKDLEAQLAEKLKVSLKKKFNEL